MSSRDYPHFFLTSSADPEAFTPRVGGGGDRDRLPEVDPREHGMKLRDQLSFSLREAELIKEQAKERTGTAKSGVHLTFESFEGAPLKLESLEDRTARAPAEIVAFRRVPGERGAREIATVWMPPRGASNLERKLAEFAVQKTKKGLPRHQPLVQALASIGLSQLESVWTEPGEPFPAANEERWWEVWLARRDGREVDVFVDAMDRIGAELAPGRLEFPDRSVLKVRTTAQRLSTIALHLDGLAELRAVSEDAEFFHALPAREQMEWIEDLLGRARFVRSETTPAVCILDTGLQHQHPLIAPAVLGDGLHAYDLQWGPEDDVGHGTEMAGNALFGDSLADLLAGSDLIEVPIGIESVKILPPPPRSNPESLWAVITTAGVASVELVAPRRRRAFTLAVTASQVKHEGPHAANRRGEGYGIPTSWSASIDATAAGQAIDIADSGISAIAERELEAARLFVVSAGNVRSPWTGDYKDRCALEPLEDPAQAWNAITVGAFTGRSDPSPHLDCRPLAEPGDLSPHSRTSQLFDDEWPLKPDIVLEGGNLAVNTDGEVIDPDGMRLLTTDGRFGRWTPRNLVVTSGTSPATAIAGGVAARIWSEYPDLWPETVRALLSHSARWTYPMRKALAECSGKTERGRLIRAFGMGVPSLDRALRSASDAVTLIAEEVIHPFEDGKHREMHLHQLPWPVEVLRSLGEIDVRLRITLSFFISPNPSRRGWRGRYVYPSHGLRFDVRRPLESVDAFRARINARATDAGVDTVSDSGDWVLGPKLRRRGSLISDIWTGSAAELADRGSIAVFPSSGWWKTQKCNEETEKGARYALVISIEAPEIDVDLWTAVSQEISAQAEVEVGS